MTRAGVAESSGTFARIGDVQIEASPSLVADRLDDEHPIPCERGTWFKRYAGM